MKKLLIQVFCPSTSKSYDFWIPSKMTVQKAIELICDDIRDFENNPGLFADASGLLLYSELEEKPLLPDLTIAQTGVRSGDRIALI